MNAYLMVGLVFLFVGSQGFIFPNTSALALAPFSELAGSASALLGSLQMAIGAISSGAVSYLHNETAIPMTSVMAACATLSFLIVLISSPRQADIRPDQIRR